LFPCNSKGPLTVGWIESPKRTSKGGSGSSPSIRRSLSATHASWTRLKSSNFRRGPRGRARTVRATSRPSERGSRSPNSCFYRVGLVQVGKYGVLMDRAWPDGGVGTGRPTDSFRPALALQAQRVRHHLVTGGYRRHRLLEDLVPFPKDPACGSSANAAAGLTFCSGPGLTAGCRATITPGCRGRFQVLAPPHPHCRAETRSQCLGFQTVKPLYQRQL
jgi:hypothetical protein